MKKMPPMKRKNPFFRYHIIMTLILILSGCAHKQAGHDFPEADNWKIQPGTKVSIIVEKEPSFSNRDMIVDKEGYIQYASLGKVLVTKYSEKEFRYYLTEELSEKYFRNPKIDISFEYTAKIYVLGEVNTPGLIEIQNPVTVLEAIKLAGSFSENSRRNTIRIVRQTSTGEKMKMISLKKIGSTWIKNENILVMPNDLIMVN